MVVSMADSWVAVSAGSAGGMGWVGVKPCDRDQGQPQVADPCQHAVQRGLVGERAGQDGGAVAGGGEAHAVEPGGPAAVEAASEADLVATRVGEAEVPVLRH